MSNLDRARVVDALPSYEVGEEIGRGGWGIVLLARHLELDRQVAVKQLPVAFAADPTVRARFKEEARMVARLDNPHITPVYDFIEHDGLCLIIMEYLSGGSLWDHFTERGVTLDEACGYILVATAALDHAHDQNILHRDIKPENFLFDDRPGVIKLSDFGIAKVLGAAAANLTNSGQVVGTPAYMAPEQILGKPVTPATDVYACGIMLYELISGMLPYADSDDPMQQIMAKLQNEPRPLQEARPGIPDDIANVVSRAIATDPEDRYQTAREFGEALAVAATQVLGRGWLRKGKVELLAGGHLIAITERTPTDITGSFGSLSQAIRATNSHTNLAALVAEARNEPNPTPAAWYPDPMHRHELRWWDGERWTDYAARLGMTIHDPVHT